MGTDNSNSGYAETAGVLIPRYESISFEQVHGPVLHLFPQAPSRMLDIGAGTGRDAAALGARGHTVTAVEPTTELRTWGEQAHAARGIRWLDDMLPELNMVRALRERFDLILLTAVWMHLDDQQQAKAMQTLAELLAPGGMVSMTLRHGPVPEGRRMFDVSAQQVIALAQQHGLAPLHVGRSNQDMLDRGGVTWSYLVLQACQTP